MTHQQFTIGRMMIAIAWMACLLAALRALGTTLGTILWMSISTGWLAWRVARGRPRLAVGGTVAAVGAWQVAVAAWTLATAANLIISWLAILFLGYPILFGFGLAWMQADCRPQSLRSLAGWGLILSSSLFYGPVLVWIAIAVAVG